MNQIDISIIVPIYNVELYLEKCIRSILNQTFQNFELILVNDGSTDSSREICNEFAQKDERIKVIHKENGGVSSARNAGLKIATGKYIGFVDPDDYIENTMYEKLYELCRENEAEIGVCQLGREIDGRKVHVTSEERILTFNTEEALRELFKGILYRFSLCNKLFKHSCFNNVKFPEGRIHEDLSTCYLLFSNAKKIIYVNFPGYIYVKREESILTSVYSEKRLDAFKAWKEINDFIKKNYPSVLDIMLACFVYACIDHIYYILNQVEQSNIKQKYLRHIRGYLKQEYSSIMKLRTITIIYKLKITIFIMSIYSFEKLNRLKRTI